ncbi:MAG: hypothetical protein GC160_18955 [Acidobacteria bacterium]|nr:hypothetical protein [Acidobacteriota bacterium]
MPSTAPPTGKKARPERRRRVAAEPAQSPAAAAPSAWRSPERLALLGILLLALGLRLYRLMTDYPIVGDEGIYLRWAEIIDHQGQWFISLLDGKQPLSYWLYALERMALPNADPLWTGRLVSVAAGVATTAVIWRVGVKLGSSLGGLLGAALYAVFPWAMMYDRLIYTEALVNLAGASFAWACLWAFETERPTWKREALAGLILGLGYFLKSTALLFAAIPLAVGLWKGRGRPLELLARWAVMGLVALVFPVISWVGKPDAPMFETQSTVLHQTGFFVDPAKFLEDPFYRMVINGPRLGEYLPYLLGWPATAAVFLSLGYLLWRRSAPGLVLLVAGGAPLLFEVFVLTFLPTRYPFPHLWPWLLMVGLAAAGLREDLRERLPEPKALQAALAAFVLLAAGPMLVRSWLVLNDPKNNISPHDSGYYFGTYSHAGFGVREAVDFLRNEALVHGPFLLLVDPIWSVPADAIFPYLNEKYGIRVHEAWWTQLSGDHPIMPLTEVELMRSQYERIPAGKIDFRREPRVFYLTDTNYYKPEAVAIRQPTARMVRRFVKPGGDHSVDIYRLK